MRISIRTVVLLAALIALAGIAEAGPSKERAEDAVEAFNAELRSVRPEHPLLPVNYLEHGEETYGYRLSRQFARLAAGGEQFRIKKLKTKERHVILELETASEIELKLYVYDRRKLTQVFLDEVLPLVLRSVFAFGEPPPLVPCVVNTRSGLVHLGACNHLPAADRRREYASLDAALADGHRACGICYTDEVVLPLEGYSPIRNEALEQARIFELAFPPVEDPAVQRRVQELGEAILADWPLDLLGLDYEFKVVRSHSPTALCFATGLVYVTDALLAIIEDPLELEFVLAHEIAHCELNLPPVGDPEPPAHPLIPGSYAYLAAWHRYRETVADLVAVTYLRRDHADEELVAGARSILDKLQFAHEALPLSGETGYGTHPSYRERRRMFDEESFTLAAANAPRRFRPWDDGGVFELRILGKSTDEDRTHVYVLIEGTDLVDEAWHVDRDCHEFLKFADASGKGYALHNTEVGHVIGPGEVAIVKADVGGRKEYAKLDLSAPPREWRGGWRCAGNTDGNDLR